MPAHAFYSALLSRRNRPLPTLHHHALKPVYDCPSCLTWLAGRPTLSRTMVARMCCEMICAMAGVHIDLGSVMPKQANCHKAKAVEPDKKPRQLNLTKRCVSGMKYSTLTKMQCSSPQQRGNGTSGGLSHISGISHAKATCQSKHDTATNKGQLRLPHIKLRRKPHGQA